MDKITSFAGVEAALAAAVDPEYKAFNDRIINCSYPTIGVRAPILKKTVKAVDIACRDKVLAEFFAKGEYTYEDVLVAGCVAARKGDYEKTREYLKKIIPLFASWAHPDCVMPWLSWVEPDKFLHDFNYLLGCDGEYEVRTYIIYLFDCLTPDRIDFVLDTLKTVKYGKYYVDMAAAWLLAECLVKFYDKALPLFTTPTFPKFVHNKAIQKARESYRIAPEVKNYLNTLKVK